MTIVCGEKQKRCRAVLLISDMQIADKHHTFTKFSKYKEEMYDAALLSSVRLSHPSQGAATQLAAMLAAILVQLRPASGTQYTATTRTTTLPGLCYVHSSVVARCGLRPRITPKRQEKFKQVQDEFSKFYQQIL